MSITIRQLTLPGFNAIHESPLPILRDPHEHGSIESSDNMPPRLKEGFGHYTGARILPYKAQNHYKRSQALVDLTTIVMENDVMRATFLPDYGGRLYSLYNKALKRELLSCNPVFQPANLAQRNAWFSGGIEWNIGHYGHSSQTCEPLFFGECMNDDGESFLRMYDYERVTKQFYQIDFHLPQGADHLITYTKIINPYPQPSPLYYWSNTAVSELNNARVYSSTENVVYVKPYLDDAGEMVNTMVYGQMPYLPGIDGDVSYPRNFERSNEYFYQTDAHEPYPWEAVAYKDGTVFYECSTMPLRYRKMFCWGTHQGGTKWQDYLTHGSDDKYVEIQAGIFPTQLHSETMAPESNIEFMQLFGLSSNLDTEAYYTDYRASTKYICQHIFDKHKPNSLNNLNEQLSKMASRPIQDLITMGQGWGALELKRLEKEGRPLQIHSMNFPIDSMSEDQDYWVALLSGHSQAKPSLNTIAPSFMTDTSWLTYINSALDAAVVPSEIDLLNKALILSESFEDSAAVTLMETYKDGTSTAMYLRTLGALLVKLDRPSEAWTYYEEANSKLNNLSIPYFEVDFIAEYMKLLFQLNEIELIWSIYQERKTQGKEITEEMLHTIGYVAFAKEDWSTLNQLFTLEPEHIRENKNSLCELWFKKKAYDLGNVALSEVRETYTPPANIDFRMS